MHGRVKYYPCCKFLMLRISLFVIHQTCGVVVCAQSQVKHAGYADKIKDTIKPVTQAQKKQLLKNVRSVITDTIPVPSKDTLSTNTPHISKDSIKSITHSA